jgi:protease-4
VDRAELLAGLGRQEVRLKVVTAHRTPLEALRHAFGVSESSLHTLAAAAQLLNDPRARGVIDELSSDRLREEGATVLAPLPRF